MTVEGGAASSGLINRAKGILLSPKTEWAVVDAEPATVGGIYTRYVMILAAIPAIISLLTTLMFSSMMSGLGGMFGVSVALSPVWAIMNAIVSYVLSLVMVFVFALIIDMLATSFGAQKSQIQALKVSAYSTTAYCIASIATIIPVLGMLVVLAAAIYTCYLIYLGLRQVMKAPEDKAVGYTAVVIVIGIIAAIIIGFVVNFPLAMARGAAGGLFGAASPTVRIGDANVNLGKLEQAAKDLERAAENIEASAENGSVTINTGASTAPDVLQGLLPTALPGGFTRTEISGGGMQGVAMGAEAVYQRGDARIDLNVVDSGAMGALAGIAGGVTSNRTTATGYEKMGAVNGRMTTERYDRSNNSGEYGVMVGNRFMVTAEGNGVTIQDLKNAVQAVPFNRLEAMAKG